MRFWRSGLWSRTLAFQLLVVVELVQVFLVSSQGQNYSMTAEQIVDNPVPRRGFDEGLQGFPPGQSTAASSEQIVDLEFRMVAGMTFLLRQRIFQIRQGKSRGFSHFSPKEKKCEDHFALESESASERQLIRAERSSNGSCRSPSGLLR